MILILLAMEKTHYKLIIFLDQRGIDVLANIKKEEAEHFYDAMAPRECFHLRRSD